MDVHIRFWKDGSVSTRYFTSYFIGHARAVDLRSCIEDVMVEVGSGKVVQV